MKLDIFLNEESSTIKEIKESENIVAINDEFEKYTIHAFNFEKEFTKWRKSSGFNKLKNPVEGRE